MTQLFISLAITIILFLLIVKIKQYADEIQQLEIKLAENAAAHIIEKAKIKKDSTFRSSAVNWGKSIEHFVPFMTKFPLPPEDVVFIGMPIDYVGFTHTDSKAKCEVHFIEVKSGKSMLMGKQRNIKKAIQEGRVYWHEIAVDGNRAEVVED